MDGCDRLLALRDAIREAIGSSRYAAWFEGAVTLRVDRERVTVAAPTTFERDRVRKQFDGELREAVDQVFEGSGVLSYGVEQADASEEPTRTGRGTTAPRRPERRADRPRPVAAKPTTADAFADWIEGPTTAEATRVCRRVLAGDLAASPALLWGPAGVGKSHLLGAVSTGARALRRRTLLLTAEQFLVAFVEAIRGGGLPSFRAKHRGVEVFLLDNVHQLIGKERTVEELQHSIDTIASDGGRVVLTSDRGPAQLAGLGPEIASRLAGGVAAEMTSPEPATRAELLRRAAAVRGRELPEEVVTGLATRMLGGAREVSGALNRLLLLHETYDLPLDAALAERVADDLNRVATPPVRIDDIQKAVCGVFGVDAGALRSKRRTKSCTEPRMLAMWLARKLTGSAWSEIGAHFGQRSHSTVISAHRRVESLLAANGPTRLSGSAGELRDAIRRVEAALRRA